MALQSFFPLRKETTPGTIGKDITICFKNEQENWPFSNLSTHKHPRRQTNSLHFKIKVGEICDCQNQDVIHQVILIYTMKEYWYSMQEF